ncbi:hypothetical protein DFH08DRAFT_862906 [Mycena albidolilacea]|uniref:Uncharacterized protein n=1 Tax=Mycena albidolilacea TaxID=1033008 RepID=A0AAD7A4Y5_9AGAR|nr:hypothetical protein DFH08DRAFT_862906 [Mycena albidolilacea]
MYVRRGVDWGRRAERGGITSVSRARRVNHPHPSILLPPRCIYLITRFDGACRPACLLCAVFCKILECGLQARGPMCFFPLRLRLRPHLHLRPHRPRVLCPRARGRERPVPRGVRVLRVGYSSGMGSRCVQQGCAGRGARTRRDARIYSFCPAAPTPTAPRCRAPAWLHFASTSLPCAAALLSSALIRGNPWSFPASHSHPRPHLHRPHVVSISTRDDVQCRRASCLSFTVCQPCIRVGGAAAGGIRCHSLQGLC